MFILTGGLCILYSTFQFTEELPRGLFMVWVCGIYFLYCGIWAVLPAAVAKLFGVKNMASNYAIIQIAYVSVH